MCMYVCIYVCMHVSMYACMHACMYIFANGSAGKEPTFSAGDLRDVGSISGSGRFPGEGSGYPLQYSCLENPMDGAWMATVHGVVYVCVYTHRWTSQVA